jgi:hypothetical protein
VDDVISQYQRIAEILEREGMLGETRLSNEAGDIANG